MAQHTRFLSFLLLPIVFFSLKSEARESKFFNKATNNPTRTATVEPPSPAPSPSESPVASPSEVEDESYGYGLYGHSRDEFAKTSSDTLFDTKFASEEFSEQRSKEELNMNGVPSNYNQHSYVTIPQGANFYDKKYTPSTSNYNDEFANEHGFTPTNSNYNDKFVNQHKFTPMTSNYNNEFVANSEVESPEEKDLFNNGYYVKEQNQNAYVNVNELSEAPKFVEKDNGFNYNNNVNNAYERNTYYNVDKPQGLSDTRTLENGKYHYALEKPSRQSGYYGNGEQSSNYEFDTMEEFEREEGYPQGEYIP